MPPRGRLDAPSPMQQGLWRVPWASDQVLGLMVVNVIGLTLVFAGWWWAAGTAKAGTQVAGLNLSVLGLVLSGGANGLWLTRQRRVVTLARGRVERMARAVVLSNGSRLPVRSGVEQRSTNGNHVAVTAPADRRQREGLDTPQGLFASPAMSYYHRPDCLLAAGKQLDAADEAAHVAAGRRPCEVCQP
jgi:hypothetical protein